MTHSGTSTGGGSWRVARFRGVAGLVGVTLTTFFGFEGELLGVNSVLCSTAAFVWRLVPAKSTLSRNL